MNGLTDYEYKIFKTPELTFSPYIYKNIQQKKVIKEEVIKQKNKLESALLSSKIETFPKIKTFVRDTSIILNSSLPEYTTLKENLIRLLKNEKITIKDEKLFYNLLNKLHQDEIQLVLYTVKKLLDENYSFHIEVYETDGDLEDLYFVIHYEKDTPDDRIDEEIFRLNEYVREIDKEKVLWFVGFTSEIEDV